MTIYLNRGLFIFTGQFIEFTKSQFQTFVQFICSPQLWMLFLFHLQKGSVVCLNDSRSAFPHQKTQLSDAHKILWFCLRSGSFLQLKIYLNLHVAIKAWKFWKKTDLINIFIEILVFGLGWSSNSTHKSFKKFLFYKSFWSGQVFHNFTFSLGPQRPNEADFSYWKYKFSYFFYLKLFLWFVLSCTFYKDFRATRELPEKLESLYCTYYFCFENICLCTDYGHPMKA